ncbi:MAG: hypothetical protein IJZ74_01650 [Clostridia bacterium]|nr:hypothetical protein [Clostridia bacterium]
MEDMIGVVIMLIVAVVSAINSANKKQKNAAKSIYATPSSSPAKVQRAPAAQPTPMIPAEAYTPAAISVHTHLEPDCSTHDLPGSTGYASTEGKDPCHDEQLAGMRSYHGDVQEQSGLTLEWTGDSMVKAFVMQEVLTRPCQRRASR